MRYRLRWGKSGKLRYVSHHDEALIFERAARRGGLPVAYSKGFTPHPKIAFGSGLPVGYGSKVELLDIELSEPWEPERVIEAYNRGLPGGLEILGASVLPPGAASLGVLIQAADYEVACTADWLQGCIARFMALSSYEVVKPYKGGERTDDLRAGVLSAAAVEGGLTMRCAIKPRSIRPSDVFAVLEKLQGVSNVPVTFERTTLLTKRGDGFQELSEDHHEMKVAS